MKAIILMAAIFAIGTAHAEEPKKEYKKHFENPVVDARIEFSGCALSGAVFGALTGEPGDVICWGQSKSDASKEYYVYKAADRKTQDYFEVIAKKDLGGFGESDMGRTSSTVTIRELGKDLEAKDHARRSTLKFSNQWIYSEGTTWLKGNLPGGRVTIDSPAFSLSTIDEEMEQLRRELGR